jgi:hypothetical protein
LGPQRHPLPPLPLVTDLSRHNNALQGSRCSDAVTTFLTVGASVHVVCNDYAWSSSEPDRRLEALNILRTSGQFGTAYQAAMDEDEIDENAAAITRMPCMKRKDVPE